MAKFSILFAVAAATLVVATFPTRSAEARTYQPARMLLAGEKHAQHVEAAPPPVAADEFMDKCMSTLTYECFEEYDRSLYAMKPFARRCCGNLLAMEKGCHEELKRVQMAMPWSENDYEEKTLNQLDGNLWRQCEHSQGESIRL